MNGADICVGDYVRTKQGTIYKVKKIMNNEKGNMAGIYDEDGLYNNLNLFPLTKHSSNILDLIEVGDYVNGYKVISVDRDVLDTHTDCIELDLNNNYQYNFITINQIKSILTHEQFKSAEYIVRED